MPVHEPGVDESTKLMVKVASHASVAVGATHVGVAGQLIGVVWAAQVITGAVTSTTFTTWVHTIGVTQPAHKIELWIVYEPQVVPEETVTEAPVFDPTIIALLVLLVMVQVYAGV